MQTKKPRNEYVGFTTNGNFATIEFVYESDGSLSFGDNVKDVKFYSEYERPKGPKTLNKLPLDARKVFWDPWKNIQRNFDLLFAVDTNTRDIAGHKISYTGVVEISQQYIGGSNGITMFWKYLAPICLEFVDLTWKPENTGWLMAIDTLARLNRLDLRKRIGIIVDSELDKLQQYNDRTLPFCEREHLPHNVTLIYASSDTSKDMMFNNAIGVADSIASQCFQKLQSMEMPWNDNLSGMEFCKHFRVIHAHS